MKSCQICKQNKIIEKVMHDYKNGKLPNKEKPGSFITRRKDAISVAMGTINKPCYCTQQ